MNYTGKLYGKGHGRTYFPLVLTSEDVDRMEKEHAEMKEALEYILGLGLNQKTRARAERALGISCQNAEVCQPEGAKKL